MARGHKKHLKRINTPKTWYLNKLSGLYAPRPSSGPHKLRECIPMTLLIRDQLRYALTFKETKAILGQRTVAVDGKIRTDRKFPLGLMDVVSIKKCGDNFRMLLDVKGRMKPHKIAPEEAAYKLLRVNKLRAGVKGIPTACTHDGRNVMYVDSAVRANDTLVYDLASKEVKSFIKFELGCAVMVSAGGNAGRVGVLRGIKKHPGATDVVDIEDAAGHHFTTRLEYVFVIGKDLDNVVITIPKGDGVKKSIIQERNELIARFEAKREQFSM